MGNRNIPRRSDQFENYGSLGAWVDVLAGVGRAGQLKLKLILLLDLVNELLEY